MFQADGRGSAYLSRSIFSLLPPPGGPAIAISGWGVGFSFFGIANYCRDEGSHRPQLRRDRFLPFFEDLLHKACMVAAIRKRALLHGKLDRKSTRSVV